MSIKSTISHGEKFHLFEETGEDDIVFLEIEDTSGCSFELWHMPDDKKKSRAVVRIPVSYWRKMVKDWKNQPNREKINKKAPKFD